MNSFEEAEQLAKQEGTTMTQPNKPCPSWEKEARKAARKAGHYDSDATPNSPEADLREETAFIAGARWAQEKAAAPGEESWKQCKAFRLAQEKLINEHDQELSSLKATAAALRENLAEATKALEWIAAGKLTSYINSFGRPQPSFPASAEDLSGHAKMILAKLRGEAKEGKIPPSHHTECHRSSCEGECWEWKK